MSAERPCVRSHNEHVTNVVIIADRGGYAHGISITTAHCMRPEVFTTTAMGLRVRGMARRETIDGIA